MLAAMLWALTGFTAAPADGEILFAGDSSVPPAVQAFAWRVIETRCRFQGHELAQRTFWAHDARTNRADGGAVYSIKILSDLAWKKTEPPAALEIVVADDGHGLRLAALTSSFIVCVP